MRVALVQVASPEGESFSERIERVGRMVLSARGADLIVLPELWGVGYLDFESYEAGAEPMDGATVERARMWARELNAYVHLGSFVESADAGLRNTAVLIDREGRLVHRYSKVHVFGYRSLEAKLLTPGDNIAVVDTDFGAVSSTTCYDLRFPELWRSILDLGAEIVIVPAAWPLTRLAHWRLFTSARAVEEQVIVIACNAVGRVGAVELGGHSRIVDAWGSVLIEAGAEEGIVFCDIDPSSVAAVRAEFPVLKDRLESYAHLDAHKEGNRHGGF